MDSPTHSYGKLTTECKFCKRSGEVLDQYAAT